MAVNKWTTNKWMCECGGLKGMCEALGRHSIGPYKAPPKPEVTVVWSGRGELLGDRPERQDARIWSMPTYDLDDGEKVDTKPPRRYNRTGRHIGKCSRTNPNAPQYIPTKRPVEGTDGSETTGHAGTD